MSKILFIIIGKEKPSSRKRVLDSLDYLREHGFDADVITVPKGAAARAGLLLKLKSYDVVVLQKKLFGPGTLKLIRSANPKLIYDFDDAVMFHEVERGEPLSGKFFSRFVNTVSSCRGVIAGNSYLASFAEAAAPDNVKVITLPTPVDTDAITPIDKMPGKRVVIGWMGTKGNLQELMRLEPVLEDVLTEHPSAVLKVVSNAKPSFNTLHYDFKQWNAADESEDLAGFDIGLMPLDDNIWTRGKGGYKLLQYMSAGVASIASPVGINIDIVNKRNCGILASGPDDWRNAIDRLIRDESLRDKFGRKGRERVVAEYSTAGYNRTLAEFLKSFT